MKKIISAAQTRETDSFTITKEGIPSIDLMERASKRFVERFLELYPAVSSVCVFAGIGNNGGGGLAIARLLQRNGVDAQAYLVKYADGLSADCKSNFDRLDNCVVLKEGDHTGVNCELIIDAIFGSGLNRPVEGWLADLFDDINRSDVPVVSVDVPSGLFADSSGHGAVIQADDTITFQRPKRSFFVPETGRFTGNWRCVDIGLNEGFIEGQESDFYLIEPSDVGLPKREKFSHKGNFGKVQLLAGSYGKMGAAILCAKAIMRSGAGLLTVHIPREGYTAMQVSVPEAMVTVDEGAEFISNPVVQSDASAICIGPGLGVNESTVQGLLQFLRSVEKPLVLDADALNILAQNPLFLKELPSKTVLTPHVGEFHRLFGECKDGFERLERAQQAAKKYDLVIVLKGAHTAVVDSERIVFNNTGNAGMATGGSGDVLAGIITALIGQGMAASEATLSGVYLHGLAGDYAAKKVGEVSLMASDLLKSLPYSIDNVRKKKII
ncbi:NAD(P)H-hydrate dehydratase [Roseivirga pacifica]|uniref:NAD(P)H-hydrate dehydratase n=1 Tax=Roseivirga pacifica TaxID=1267423 RepID=UPI002094A8B1|nr:NAD(P)H-hydrate dehydratase [Roseivirga pacifica]MCO6357846.1 NAD(P)H-hydrate dehydratase [Roseivirga pacifica]MCO6366098.1 NAD(P)H-hydrate dehydratase [Roseivirga pacifica]MCO6371426.1 NAD(P)H-hydrate dehydratase [Roseivirga pacifica]MCO6375402.1 NAD(P)H-hydrate dehydratase [Roseivirga pacifica]MCO6378804.1 NAD(P)H-hydrate dehydratase [Roseivirga pacifica]